MNDLPLLQSRQFSSFNHLPLCRSCQVLSTVFICVVYELMMPYTMNIDIDEVDLPQY